MDLGNFGVDVKKKDVEEIKDAKLDVNFNKIKEDFFLEDVQRFLPWFLKYKINDFKDLVQTNQVKKVLDFIENFDDKKYKDKGLLLYGPAGCGKTTTLSLIGNYLNLEIIEINASDNRNKKSIEFVLNDVLNQKSLFNKSKLILIDEVDGVCGTNDRGGILEIIKFLKNRRFPIVFTANDFDSDKLKSLKKKCVNLDFTNSSSEILENVAKKIFKNEKIIYDKKKLKEFILERQSFDIRGFINDLQCNVIDFKFDFTDNLYVRDYKVKQEKLLNDIYFSFPEDSLKSQFNSEVNLDDLKLYVEENTFKVYSFKGFYKAFNQICKADLFNARIQKYQYFRFLVYVNFYLTFGVSCFKDDLKKVKYSKSSRILKKWIYNNSVLPLRKRTKIEKKKGLDLRFIEKLAKIYGCSVKVCVEKNLPFFCINYKNDLNFQKHMDKILEIDDKTRLCLLNKILN